MLFAGALVPTISVVGVAVDFARAGHVRTQLQAAVDGAAMSGATPPGAVVIRESAANSTFTANTGNIDSGVRIEKFITATSGSVYVKAEAEPPTAFMKLLGQEKLSIKAESTVSNGGKKLELALVLGTTGSMGWNNKLEELQRAVGRTPMTAAKLPTAAGAGRAAATRTVAYGGLTDYRFAEHLRHHPWLSASEPFTLCLKPERSPERRPRSL
jgi:Flp pilus assembly protein TadG